MSHPIVVTFQQELYFFHLNLELCQVDFLVLLWDILFLYVVPDDARLPNGVLDNFESLDGSECFFPHLSRVIVLAEPAFKVTRHE